MAIVLPALCPRRFARSRSRPAAFAGSRHRSFAAWTLFALPDVLPQPPFDTCRARKGFSRRRASTARRSPPVTASTMHEGGQAPLLRRGKRLLGQTDRVVGSGGSSLVAHPPSRAHRGMHTSTWGRRGRGRILLRSLLALTVALTRGTMHPIACLLILSPCRCPLLAVPFRESHGIAERRGRGDYCFVPLLEHADA